METIHSVDGNFQNTSDLKCSDSRMVHESGTCIDHQNNAYKAKNNWREINIFSVRDSEMRKYGMTNFASCSAEFKIQKIHH